MGLLRPLALVALTACYSPEIPECIRDGTCEAIAVTDAGGGDLPDAPTAPPPDAALPAKIMLIVRIDGRGDVTIPTIGTCSAGNGVAECPFLVDRGVALSLGAMPKNRWRFDRWEDACAGTTTATCTLTPTQTTSVRARFAELDD